MIRKVAMGFLLGAVEMFIKEITKQILEMGMDKCIGVMEVFIKETGQKEFNMVKDKFMSLVKDIKKDYLKIMF